MYVLCIFFMQPISSFLCSSSCSGPDEIELSAYSLKVNAGSPFEELLQLASLYEKETGLCFTTLQNIAGVCPSKTMKLIASYFNNYPLLIFQTPQSQNLGINETYFKLVKNELSMFFYSNNNIRRKPDSFQNEIVSKQTNRHRTTALTYKEQSRRLKQIVCGLLFHETIDGITAVLFCTVVEQHC